MVEIPLALFSGKAVEHSGDGSPGCLDGSRVLFAQQRFDFRKHLLDRIEVGAIGRQEDQPGASGLDRVSDLTAFMASKVVKHHDVAGPQRRDQHLANISEEAFTVDRPVKDTGCDDAVMAQRRNQGERLPMTVWNLDEQPLPALAPSGQPGHVGFDPGFVDEHEAFAVDQPRQAATHQSRRRATSGRSCSLAGMVFF